MKAVIIDQFGGPEVLHQKEIETPKVGPGEVLIRLLAAGVNRFDVTTRRGEIPYASVSFPHVPGVEGAGTVAEVAPDVTAFKVGDRVVPVMTISRGVCRHNPCYCQLGWDNICRDFDKLGLTTWGTYAEYVKVSEHNVVHLPDSLSFADAATATIATATAWELTISRAHLRQGETALVNAVGGAVGSAAVQVAKLAGAHVIASAGSDNKLELARQLGADQLINYESQDLRTEVLNLTDGRGVDVVIETVGGQVLQKSIEALAHNGRLATAGSVGPSKVEIDIFRVLRKQAWITGTHFAPKATVRTVLDLLAEDRLRPVLARSFPLVEAGEAHTLLESRDFFGNILLEIES